MVIECVFMSKAIPLVRAGALVPMMRWLVANRRPLEQVLRDADLGYMTFVDPNQPIPLRNAAKFFAIVAKIEGPDIGCRVVSDTSVKELALIGKIALGATTPFDALERVASAIPYHCSHEILTVHRTPKGIVVGEGWTVQFDEVQLHLIQQFFASIIRAVCGPTQAPKPLLARIEMTPHPEFGLAHLRKWFSVPPVPSDSRYLQIQIDSSVADRRFSKIARDRTGGHLPPGIEPLIGDGQLASSAKAVLAVQLSEGTPTIDQLATSAGLSRRTLQRQLSAEGTCFSDLLEEVRLDLAMQQLENGAGSLDDVAARLGYARQSTLTRAVRRWTGQTPSSLRNNRI